MFVSLASADSGGGSVEHLGQEVERDHPPARTRAARREHGVDAGAAAEVEDRLALFDLREAEMVTDAECPLDRRTGDLGELVR
jgi:hypothetical protein